MSKEYDLDNMETVELTINSKQMTVLDLIDYDDGTIGDEEPESEQILTVKYKEDK